MRVDLFTLALRRQKDKLRLNVPPQSTWVLQHGTRQRRGRVAPHRQHRLAIVLGGEVKAGYPGEDSLPNDSTTAFSKAELKNADIYQQIYPTDRKGVVSLCGLAGWATESEKPWLPAWSPLSMPKP